MSQSVNGIFTNTFQPINEAEHQDLPPDSAEIQELENTIEQEFFKNKHNKRNVQG